MKSYKLFLDQITEAAKKKKPNIDGDGDTGESMKDTGESMENAADDKEEDDENNDKKDK